MRCFSRFHRSIRALVPAVLVLGLVLGLQSCGQGPSAPGSGQVSVFMAFNNGFAGATSRAGSTPLGDEYSGGGDRTPLADLIVTFDSVEAASTLVSARPPSARSALLESPSSASTSLGRS